MAKLIDMARIIRSKNAGPLTISFDLMFPTESAYSEASRSPSLTPAGLSPLFDRPIDEIRVTQYAAALAIKITMSRAVISGSPGDRDVYGAQQHLPLLRVQI